jgi:hypothetical protein
MGGQVIKLANFVEVEADPDSEGAVLIDGRSGVIYSCNATAAILVSAIVKGAELEALPELMSQQFEVASDRALRDTRQFIEVLHSAGLLETIERLVARAV